MPLTVPGLFITSGSQTGNWLPFPGHPGWQYDANAGEFGDKYRGPDGRVTDQYPFTAQEIAANNTYGASQQAANTARAAQATARNAAQPGAGLGVVPGPTVGKQPTSSVTTQSAAAGDTFKPFKDAFRAAFGRDATQADLAPAALPQLSNDLLLLLPDEAIQYLPVPTLLGMSNEVLIRAARLNPNILGSVPPERFKTMPGDYVQKEVLPYLDKQDAALAAAVRTAVGTAAPGVVPLPDTTKPPAAAPPPAGDKGGLRTLSDIFPTIGNFGTPVDFSKLSQQESEYYLPWATDPAVAENTFLRPYGVDTNVANPFSAFAGGAVGNMSDLAATVMALHGVAPTQNGYNGGIANTIAGALGEGRTTVFDQPGAGQFLKDMNALVGRANAGDKTLSPEQLALATRFSDPQNVKGSAQQSWGLYQDAEAPYLNPFLRNNQALMNRAFQRRYNSWYQDAPQNPASTFLGGLVGV